VRFGTQFKLHSRRLQWSTRHGRSGEADEAFAWAFGFNALTHNGCTPQWGQWTVLADDQQMTRTPLRTGGSGTEGTDTHNREQAHSIQTELDPGWTCGVPPLRLRRVASRTDKTCIEVVPVGSLLLPYCTLKTCGLLPSDPIATCPAPQGTT